MKPGGHVPVDGIVLGGSSFVEQAAITGEAMPVEKVPGDVVYAGTMNQSGALEITAQKLGRDTTFGRIVEAVERAEKSRAPIQKTADRLAGFNKLYGKTGRPSIAPEKLLRASCCKRRTRCWFAGLNMDDAVWDVTVFTKNREREL